MHGVLWKGLIPWVLKEYTRDFTRKEMEQLPERKFLLNFRQLLVRLCPEAGEFIFLYIEKNSLFHVNVDVPII